MNFCVPTGNFGNILSGFYAKKIGVPIGRLICASNENNVLTDFIKTGTYDRNRPFYQTASPSMDILISSNLERLLSLLSGSDEEVRGYMQKLSETGRYTVSNRVLQAVQAEFSCGFCTDAQGAQTIGKAFREKNYLLDTHTAVACTVLDAYRAETSDQTLTVVESTASPFKFCASVLDALGVTEHAPGTGVLGQLTAKTGRPAPKPLASLAGKAVRFDQVTDKAAMRTVVTEFLRLMALYAIGDLHLSLGPADKPMDVFRGRWTGYMEKLRENLKVIGPEDATVLLGDLSWAMSLDDAAEDFAFMNAIPGRKIILKGNHDYWWTTLRAFDRFCAEHGFADFHVLNNSCFFYGDIALCGTRGWFYDAQKEGSHDEKIFRQTRAARTLFAVGGRRGKILLSALSAALPGYACSEILTLLKQYGVTRCYYGHLHADSIRLALEDNYQGVQYHLVSADHVDFQPQRIG